MARWRKLVSDRKALSVGRQAAGSTYVWGWPDVSIDDAPDDTRRTIFAVRLLLFRIARRFAYTRRGMVTASVLTACVSLLSALTAFALAAPLGWALATASIGPALLLILIRHRALRVRGPSDGPPEAGVREPRNPTGPSGEQELARPTSEER
jgi:uncharacterized MnhB-related membrane protein